MQMGSFRHTDHCIEPLSLIAFFAFFIIVGYSKDDIDGLYNAVNRTIIVKSCLLQCDNSMPNMFSALEQ